MGYELLQVSHKMLILAEIISDMLKYMSILSLLGLVACGNGYKNLTVDQFETETASGSVAIVDVRTPEEYAEGHLRDASNCDWKAEDFLQQMEKTYPKETPIAIYCRSGKRSADASKALSKVGYTVYNMLGGYLAWTEAGKPTITYDVEAFFTESGKPVAITLIKHGSLAISYDGLSIQVDPVSGLGKPTDYAVEFPKADIIIVTHEHRDHFDPEAIAGLTKLKYDLIVTSLITNMRCEELLGHANGDEVVDDVMANGDKMELKGITVEAFPAYNYSEGHTQFHPKGRDNGFVLSLDGLRIYIAGDTEDIPEMAELKDIDIAFLPVNQPYTMTVDQCVNAAKVIAPKVLIPYHFSNTDLSSLPDLLPEINVLLRHME